MHSIRRIDMLSVLAGTLLTAGSPVAQTLSVDGDCPGTMTLAVTGALPNSSVAIVTADGLGNDAVPAGPCVGTELGVSGDVTYRGNLQTDASGEVTITPNIPPGVCGASVQAIELGDCTVSNTDRFSFAEPTRIGLSCDPTPNPLRFGCTVTVEPPQPIEILYSRTDGEGVERVNRSDGVSDLHALPALFLSPVSEYAIEAVATDHPNGPTASTTVLTGAPPFDVDSWLTFVGESTMGLVGTETSCGDDAVAVIYDTTTGDLVWYENIDPSGDLGLNDMVRFTDELTVIGETGGTVVEVDVLGGELARFDTNYPGLNLHHDIFRWDGNYYGLYQDRQDGLTLDVVVVLDAQGNELWAWDPRVHLEIPPDASGDWLHANTVFVEDDGTILLSWLTRDSVAKIDGNLQSPTLGDVLWIVDGNPPDALPADIVVDWSNVPGADSFSDQHNFARRHDGRYMLLDNDHGRGVVLTIDEVNRTATADAVYATVENTCGPQGTATDTEDGNALVACSNEVVREYDGASGLGIWEAEVECANGGGGFFGSGVARWYSLDGWSKAYSATP